MSRPAEAVHRVIKAYDVRGLVGDEIDESLAADIGAAFARLMRAEGARRVVIGYDMRDSSPALAAAFAAGVTGQGLDVVRIGLASTDQLYFASGLLDCPGAMFTASHNPAAYNGIKLCRAGAKPVGADTGLSVISDDLIAGVPAYDGPAGTVTDRDVLARLRRVPAFAGEHLRAASACGWPSTPATAWPVTPRRPCSARSTRSPCCRCTSSSTDRFPITRPTRSTRPTWWTCRPCARHRRRYRAGLRRRRRPLLRGRRTRRAGFAVDGDQPGGRARARPRDRRDRHLQRDHLARGARTGRRARRHTAALAGRTLLYQGADGRDRRDFRRRAFGALLLP